MDNNQDIFNKIDKMYNQVDENGKYKNRAFFSHLIKSYIPANSVEVALVMPEDKKIRVRCVFSKKDLITVDAALRSATTDAFRKNINDFVYSFDTKNCYFNSTTTMDQLTGEKVIALKGKNTKTFISPDSLSTFINWVMTQYVSGDANIKWLINQMAKNELHPGITVKPKSKKAPQNQVQQYSSQGSKKSTLGDLSALKELKDKLEKDDNNN